MIKSKGSRLVRVFIKPQITVIILLPCFLIITLYLISGKYIDIKNYISLKQYNTANIQESNEDYLIWNSRCHMVSKNPMDPSIEMYVKKERYESCSNIPLLSLIKREKNGSFSLVIDKKVAQYYDEFNCCWTPINRPVPTAQLVDDWDNKINVGYCEDFKDHVTLPQNLEIVMVTCRSSNMPVNTETSRVIYQNVHSIINPLKVTNHIDNNNNRVKNKKMSILIMGLDSVSRLNFQRTMPKLSEYFLKNGWYNLKGYNKIGDNTLPNILAILTGREKEEAQKECRLSQSYGLEGCPFIWNDFKKAGYITAYGEDIPRLSTFNYKQDGFVNPPTDYYLRPYILASEKLLNSRNKFNFKYCIGPESAIDRIFNYAKNFAKTFIGKPFFGFFWANTISHDDMNGPSSMDDYFLNMFKQFEDDGVTNNTIIIFLSDHGVRWGEYLNTFVGWYENRLPFIYMKFPNSMKNRHEIFHSLRLNEYRLTSPYDIYETFRELLIDAGGDVSSSSLACPTCQSLLKPVPSERGCDDAGISSHWCTCNVLQPASTIDDIARGGADKFIQHAENVAQSYRDESGKRLCAKLEISRILKVDKIIDFKNVTSQGGNVDKYFFVIEVKPGEGKFEVTIKVEDNEKFSFVDSEIGRIDSYEKTSRCVGYGAKWFCHCL